MAFRGIVNAEEHRSIRGRVSSRCWSRFISQKIGASLHQPTSCFLLSQSREGTASLLAGKLVPEEEHSEIQHLHLKVDSISENSIR